MRLSGVFAKAIWRIALRKTITKQKTHAFDWLRHVARSASSGFSLLAIPTQILFIQKMSRPKRQKGNSVRNPEFHFSCMYRLKGPANQ
jgi:hypothetical protein